MTTDTSGFDWNGLVNLGGTLIGGKLAGQGAERAADASSAGYLQGINAMRGAADQGRRDVLAGVPVAQGNMMLGQQAASDMLAGSMAPRMNLSNQGSMAGQKSLIGGLGMANNAILGKPAGGGFTAFTPDVPQIQNNMPQFQDIASAFTPAPSAPDPDGIDMQAITDMFNAGGQQGVSDGQQGGEGTGMDGSPGGGELSGFADQDGNIAEANIGPAIAASFPDLTAADVEKYAAIASLGLAAMGQLPASALAATVSKIASFFGKPAPTPAVPAAPVTGYDGLTDAEFAAAFADADTSVDADQNAPGLGGYGGGGVGDTGSGRGGVGGAGEAGGVGMGGGIGL